MSSIIIRLAMKCLPLLKQCTMQSGIENQRKTESCWIFLWINDTSVDIGMWIHYICINVDNYGQVKFINKIEWDK